MRERLTSGGSIVVAVTISPSIKVARVILIIQLGNKARLLS